MNRIDINMTNGGRYTFVTMIDDKNVSSFESAKALMEYLKSNRLIEIKPVHEFECAVIVTEQISSINCK